MTCYDAVMKVDLMDGYFLSPRFFGAYRMDGCFTARDYRRSMTIAHTCTVVERVLDEGSTIGSQRDA